MHITHTMDLSELAQRMGTVTTEAEAREMRTILLDSTYLDVDQIPEAEWLEMISEAVSAAGSEC